MYVQSGQGWNRVYVAALVRHTANDSLKLTSPVSDVLTGKEQRAQEERGISGPSPAPTQRQLLKPPAAT